MKPHIERLEPRAAYELWADSYPAVAHNPLMRAEQEVVGPLLAHTRASRALDVGCGSGRYLPPLASTGAATVVGVDFSMAMLTRGVQAPDRQEQAPRVCADACRLPFRRGAFRRLAAARFQVLLARQARRQDVVGLSRRCDGA